MPANPQEKALIVCPVCGHQQNEPRLAVSTNCRHCGRHLIIDELLNPKPKGTVKTIAVRRVACFDCGTEIDVPLAAHSAMCKRCSSYLDLQDYSVSGAVSKNYKTKGRFVVEPKGFVFNTTVVAPEIIIKGRLIGKLAAEKSLTVYSTAKIEGTFRTPLLIIPAENCFRWKNPLRVESIDIAGEYVGNICADQTVTVRARGRLFGDVYARQLVVEAGAVLVGQYSIGPNNRGEPLK